MSSCNLPDPSEDRTEALEELVDYIIQDPDCAVSTDGQQSVSNYLDDYSITLDIISSLRKQYGTEMQQAINDPVKVKSLSRKETALVLIKQIYNTVTPDENGGGNGGNGQKKDSKTFWIVVGIVLGVMFLVGLFVMGWHFYKKRKGSSPSAVQLRPPPQISRTVIPYDPLYA